MGDLEAIVFSPAEAAQHRNAWQALNAGALSPNPFFGPDFLLPYLAWMERREAKICAVRRKSDGAFAALAPFVNRRAGLVLPAALALATDYGPLGTPLLQPGEPAEAFDLLLDAAKKISPSGVIAFPYLRTDDAVAAALAETAEAKGWHLAFDNPQIRAGHGCGEAGKRQFGNVTKGRLKELRRQLRRLCDLAETKFSSTSDPAELPAAFERFLRLEAKSWKGNRGSALSSNSQSALFAHAFIEAASARKALRIDELTHAGEPVAMLVLLREGNRLFAWKTAYDEAFARFSPGSQLAREAMRLTLAEKGERDGDSLAIPGHPMISPLWRGEVPYATAVIAPAPQAAARAAMLAADMATKRRLKQAAKATLARLKRR